jgi:hypothetical protein
MEAGDYDGALETFGEAMAAFETADAPVPPHVACGAALAALRMRGASDEAAREIAAKQADRCFRSSLPGDPLRVQVQAAVARMRFDGIDLRLFDQPSPPERFFTLEPTRPTADAIDLTLDLPDSEERGFELLRESLLSEEARHAIGSCFVQDWEQRHERSVEADLVLKYATQLRDMGDYDLFVPQVEITTPGESQAGFGPCLARSLSEVLRPGPRGAGVMSWQESFSVRASVR